MRLHLTNLVISSLVVFSFVGCNSKIAPDTAAASYAADIIAAVNEVQKVVNTLADVRPETVEVGRKITSVNEKILASAKRFDALLVVYHNSNGSNSAEVKSELESINNLVLSLIELNPDNQVLLAVKNVLSIVFNVSSRIK